MADAPLRALTVWQPWAWAIVQDAKAVENRGWEPPGSLIGETLLIHAGLRVAPRTVSELQRQGVPVPLEEELVRGAIIGAATVTGWVSEFGHSGIDAARAGYLRSSVWFIGPIGWVLDNRRAIDPIPCRGRQGLWVPDADVQERVREALHG